MMYDDKSKDQNNSRIYLFPLFQVMCDQELVMLYEIFILFL